MFWFVLSSILVLHENVAGVGLPGDAGGKEPACPCRTHKRCAFSPWVGKMPWRRAWHPLQYSRLENPKDRGAWWATVHGVAKSQARLKWLSTHACTWQVSLWGETLYFPFNYWESNFLGRLIRCPGVPKERGVWNSQGGRRANFFVPLHSLGLYNNNVSCLRTVSGENLLVNPVFLRCKLWE